ncbi:MAG: condensation domain-containing protein, partial [Gammaproteobacteria bacterium]
MKPRELIARLREAGVRLSADSGGLRVSAPKGSLTEEYRAELIRNKVAILELLTDAGSAATRTQSEIASVARDASLPLSFSQQRLWFLDELDPGSPVYNIPWVVGLEGDLDLTALQNAADDLVQRHESLRTHFVSKGGEPRQVIDTNLSVPISYIDMSGIDDDAFRARLSEFSRASFDLSKPPLIRCYVIARAPNQHVLMIVIHHIISDAWSLDVMF